MSSDVSGTVQKDHAAFARQWLTDNNFDGDYEVVVAEGDQLMLDYDRTTLPNEFDVALAILAQSLVPIGVEPVYPPWELSRSKSGNIHVIITLPYSLSVTTRVAWQAAFGSDPKREALHLLSIRRNDLNPILLYQPKKQPLLLTEGTDGQTYQG